MKIISTSLIALAAGLFFVGIVQADFYIYTFTGVIPDGASDHPMIADGETWVARMGIDTSTPDENPDPSFGVYTGAVAFGSLEFSGGYDPVTTDFNTGDAFILDDVFSADSVRVRGELYTFQANNENLSTINSDALLGPGTTIQPFDNPAKFEYFQLTLIDELGQVSYLANDTNNVTLTITAVPEPGSACFLGLSALLASVIRRQR